MNKPKLSRTRINASILRWKQKLKYAQARLKYHQRRKSIDYIAKWRKKVSEAESMLLIRRRELDYYRNEVIRHMDSYGRNRLIEEEGLRLFPYNDSAGHATIGVGHLLHKGAVTESDKKKYHDFTRTDAEELFKKDLLKYELAVYDATRGSKVPITQNMFSAMTSLSFNVGTSGFASSSVVRFLEQGNKEKAADAFLMWNKPPELMGRRRRERSLFLKAD